MTAFGDFYHDFPRLAKQSGFYFQLHKGEVNWAEIQNLNINDITENRNFRLLEQNLINVLNCDLEECDLKFSNKNIVKLFKLAQLGLDYLAYCETYLDKCVVILQEQLFSIQDEYESLKNGKEKRKDIISKSKRKNKNLSYQCEKCQKAFISDVYLKFHDKRRHSVSNTPKSVDTSLERFTDNYQRKSSTSTQTMFLNDSATITENDGSIEKVNAEHSVKMETLEQEIRDLKERLKKAENALTEKNEFLKSSECHSPFPTPMSLSTVLLLLPSHQTQSGSCHEIKSANSLLDLGILQTDSSQSPHFTIESKTVDGKPLSHDDTFTVDQNKNFDKKESELLEKKVNVNGTEGGVENFEKHKKKATEDLECDKENVDPNIGQSVVNLTKPLPPPRKSKKVNLTREIADVKQCTVVEQSVAPKGLTKSETEDIISQPVIVKCTPIASKSFVSDSVVSEEVGENMSDINEQESTSNQSPNSSKDTLVEDRSRSSFKTILKKNSPKFLTLGRNLRKSLINLCDSVTSVGKDSKSDSVDEDVKTTVINGLNSRLRQLGVDPEWSGIPKKTMKQKLKALRHRRKFLAKENPMYPIIRQKIEEKVFQKLKKNLETNKTNLLEQPNNESVNSEDSPRPGGKTAVQSCVMYDIESESESNTSDSEVNAEENDAQNDAPIVVPHRGTIEDKAEFDLSVFQVRKESLDKKTEAVKSGREGEQLTDSDTDDDVIDKTLNCFSSNVRKNEAMKDDDERHSLSRENQSILRSADSFQSKLSLNAKKKVWFVNHSNNIGEALSVSSSEDDNLWSLKDDWEDICPELKI